MIGSWSLLDCSRIINKRLQLRRVDHPEGGTVRAVRLAGGRLEGDPGSVRRPGRGAVVAAEISNARGVASGRGDDKEIGELGFHAMIMSSQPLVSILIPRSITKKCLRF